MHFKFSAISQLTKQVSQIKLENKHLLDQFDWLTMQMEAFMLRQTIKTTQCQAGGHRSESGQQT